MIDTEWLRKQLPWNSPDSWLDNDGADCTVTIHGHCFRIEPTGQQGIHSGRERWRVSCVTCGTDIHEATTSASARIRHHLDTEGLR